MDGNQKTDIEMISCMYPTFQLYPRNYRSFQASAYPLLFSCEILHLGIELFRLSISILPT
jgi:hypothetical protein